MLGTGATCDRAPTVPSHSLSESGEGGGTATSKVAEGVAARALEGVALHLRARCTMAQPVINEGEVGRGGGRRRVLDSLRAVCGVGARWLRVWTHWWRLDISPRWFSQGGSGELAASRSSGGGGA